LFFFLSVQLGFSTTSLCPSFLLSPFSNSFIPFWSEYSSYGFHLLVGSNTQTWIPSIFHS
jgi:hypothetical protein